MIQPNLPRNSIKRANNLMKRLNGCSPYDLSICAKRDAIKEFYPRYNRGPNGTPVDKLPENQVTAIFLDLYENALKLIREDPRQVTYLSLKQLEQAFREKKDIDEIVDLEQRVCIQLEPGTDTYDYELEHEYFALQTLKEDDFVPFSSSQGK